MRNAFENYRNEYTLKNDWIFPYTEIPKNSRILLYGAGEVGQSYYRQICFTRYCEIVAWADKQFNIYSDWDLQVVSPDIAINKEFEYVVIAVASANLARNINDELVCKGISQDKIVWIGRQESAYRGSIKENFLYDPVRYCAKMVLKNKGIEFETSAAYKYMSNVMGLTEQNEAVVLPRIVIELTSVCTLKCNGCNNLMPLYHKPTHQKIEDVLFDIKRLALASDRILIMELIGGEPFSYPQLEDVVSYVLKNKIADMIEITTNGTIVPNERVLNALQDERVCVKISRYKKSYSVDDIIEKFKNNNIKYTLMEEMIWIDSGEPIARGESKDELMNKYYICTAAKLCKTIYKGRLFSCARAASIYDLGIFMNEEDSVDLSGDNLKHKIWNYLRNVHIDPCDYCSYTDQWRKIEAGKQINDK